MVRGKLPLPVALLESEDFNASSTPVSATGITTVIHFLASLRTVEGWQLT